MLEDEEPEVCIQCGMVHDGSEGCFSFLALVFILAFVVLAFMAFSESSLN